MSQKAKATFFDVDGVVYKGNLGVEFIQHLCANKVFGRTIQKRLDEILSRYRIQKDPWDFYEKCEALWSRGVKNKSKSVIVLDARCFVSTVLEHTYQRALQAIRRDRNDRYMIIFISGSPIEVVQEYSERLNECARLFWLEGCVDYIAGAEMIQREGKYTGESVKPWLIGDGKADRAHIMASMFNIDLTKSKAYGDSELDAKMLEIVGRPIIVRPSEKLKKIAHVHSWNEIADDWI